MISCFSFILVSLSLSMYTNNVLCYVIFRNNEALVENDCGSGGTGAGD